MGTVDNENTSRYLDGGGDMRKLAVFIPFMPFGAGLMLGTAVMLLPETHNGLMAAALIGFALGALASTLFMAAMEDLKKARLMSARNRRRAVTIDGVATRMGGK